MFLVCYFLLLPLIIRSFISLNRESYFRLFDVQYVNTTGIDLEETTTAQMTPYQQLSILKPMTDIASKWSYLVAICSLQGFASLSSFWKVKVYYNSCSVGQGCVPLFWAFLHKITCGLV